MKPFALILLAACTTSVMQPVNHPPTYPRSVAEAVGMADLALAPISMGCLEQGHTQTVWCSANVADELGEVFARWGAAAVVGVVAHEKGHRLGYAPAGLGLLAHSPELVADAWAGCVLARTALPTREYLELVADLDAADSKLRTEATLKGYETCKGK